MGNHLSTFGLADSASTSEVDAAALSLITSLSQEFSNAKAAEQAKVAATAIRLAYEQYCDGADNNALGEQSLFHSRLRLGQLCLAAGMISLEQLEEAVKEQLRSDTQLGEILLAKQFISQEELDGLLIGQDLIAPEEKVSDPLALQLMALGLVSDDLMMIALLEQRFAFSSVGEVLIRRGWIEAEIIQALKAG